MAGVNRFILNRRYEKCFSESDELRSKPAREAASGRHGLVVVAHDSVRKAQKVERV